MGPWLLFTVRLSVCEVAQHRGQNKSSGNSSFISFPPGPCHKSRDTLSPAAQANPLVPTWGMPRGLGDLVVGTGKGYGEKGQRGRGVSWKRGKPGFSQCTDVHRWITWLRKNHLYLWTLGWSRQLLCWGLCPHCLCSPTVSLFLCCFGSTWLTMYFIF